MSDRFYACITIGGRLPQKDVGGFIAAIQYEGMEDGPKDETSLLLSIVDKGKPVPLRMSNGSAPYGQFNKLEDYCRQHDLTYQRDSDSYSEYNAETIYWAPGMKKPLSNITDQHATVTVYRYEIENLFKKTKRFIKRVGSPENAPLFINHKDPVIVAYAKYLLSSRKKKIDPMALMELGFSIVSPVAEEVPPLEIV